MGEQYDQNELHIEQEVRQISLRNCSEVPLLGRRISKETWFHSIDRDRSPETPLMLMSKYFAYRLVTGYGPS
ncbi:hypothetical protein TNCV_2046121 [Trichonephila clavipes]|uniref:Uncharacterized protein n=1 Tax=Trichonephila clavipes TaxID=2585209 RepID=A0A8X6SRG9_TRICX|nr:hypothetical protein TNCV_2046121 [Trichonephila clavipes]